MAKGVRARSRRDSVPVCLNCVRRNLKAADGYDLSEHELEVFRLKVRDHFSADSAEYRPCLGRCPEAGVTVERRGRAHVMDAAEIQTVQSLFDPTRQLSLFELDPPSQHSGAEE